MSATHRRRQKHRINKLHRKKHGKKRGKGKAWNTKRAGHGIKQKGKEKRMENKAKQKK